MGSREIRIAKTMILEAMLLGAALAQDGDKEMVVSSLRPEDMASVTMRSLLEAILDKDKERFTKIIRRRYGVEVKHGERALPAILRATKLRGANEAVRGMCLVMLETVSERDSLSDICEMWEEGLDALKRVAEMERENVRQSENA